MLYDACDSAGGSQPGEKLASRVETKEYLARVETHEYLVSCVDDLHDRTAVKRWYIFHTGP